MAKAREGDGIQLPPAVSLGLISTPLERDTETEMLELSRDTVRLLPGGQLLGGLVAAGPIIPLPHTWSPIIQNPCNPTVYRIRSFRAVVLKVCPSSTLELVRKANPLAHYSKIQKF